MKINGQFCNFLKSLYIRVDGSIKKFIFLKVILFNDAPQQNDFRTFCMNEEAEKVYQKLEEVMIIS